MDPTPFLDRVLEDEGLTGSLDEAEATVLVGELITRVKKLAASSHDVAAIDRQVNDLCRRGRQVADVVAAQRDRGEATAKTMATSNGFEWPATSENLLHDLIVQLDRKSSTSHAG